MSSTEEMHKLLIATIIKVGGTVTLTPNDLTTTANSLNMKANADGSMTLSVSTVVGIEEARLN